MACPLPIPSPLVGKGKGGGSAPLGRCYSQSAAPAATPSPADSSAATAPACAADLATADSGGRSPLPDAIDIPLYLVLLGVLVFGFIVGEFVGWVRSWRWKREARRSRERIALLERELEAERAKPAAGPAVPVVAR